MGKKKLLKDYFEVENLVSVTIERFDKCVESQMNELDFYQKRMAEFKDAKSLGKENVGFLSFREWRLNYLFGEEGKFSYLSNFSW